MSPTTTPKPTQTALHPLERDVETLRRIVRPKLARLMGYYRNPTTDLADYLATRATTMGVRPVRQYQEIGLPTRITGFRSRGDGDVILAGPVDANRREVVIENDIGWRLHTLVDFTVSEMPIVASTARDAALRTRINAFLTHMFMASGGAGLLQDLVLGGAIHGAAWVLLRPSAPVLAKLAGAAESVTDPADPLQLTAIPATRVVAAFPPGIADASGAPLSAAAIVSDDATPANGGAEKNGWLERVGTWVRAAVGAAPLETPADAVDVYEPHRVRRFAGPVLAVDAINPLGFVPLAGYVNQPDPAGPPLPGLGVSDVEPLVGLQDELNTRLSDRANRVTMQSFKMYLGKGLEDFSKRPIGPGMLWMTDNADASITAFGGDASSPSEEAHITEVREALDKISGVPPVAAGTLRAKLGNLTSAVALRVTLIALLARAERKRGSLALTLQAVSRQALTVLNAAGILRTEPEDRGVEIHWPSAIPENMAEKLSEAKQKIDLGVPRRVVLAELGYDDVVEPRSHEDTKGTGDGQASTGEGTVTDATSDPRGGESGSGTAGDADAGTAGDGGVSADAAAQ